MRFPKNKALCSVAASLALATTLLTGCGAPASSQSAQSTQSGDASSQDVPEATKKAIAGEGIVSKFIGEKFYDEEELKRLLQRILGDYLPAFQSLSDAVADHHGDELSLIP